MWWLLALSAKVSLRLPHQVKVTAGTKAMNQPARGPAPNNPCASKSAASLTKNPAAPTAAKRRKREAERS